VTTSEVRPATADEWERWCAARTDRLTAAVARWYGAQDGAREQAERLLEPVVGAPEKQRALLASADGAALVAVSVTAGPARGLLDEVWVEPDRRGQGLGTAALAAGTRWLAEHGCTRAVTTIDVADPASVALCRGWIDLSQRMVLTLTESPDLAPGFSARPMTQEEYEPWVREGVDSFVQSLVASGSFDLAGAQAKSERDYAELLPGGVATDSQSLTVLESDGRRVGALWLAHHKPATRTFIFDIEIEEAERGRGFGRAAMHAAERIALAHGDRSIGLNVFGPNDVARRLYTSLGYRVTDRTLGLDLD